MLINDGVEKTKTTWIIGNSGAGKTTYMRNELWNEIMLDGDEMRKVWALGFSLEDRWEHNIRIARLAQYLNEQGYNVLVATICPYRELRKFITKRILKNVEWVWIQGGKPASDKYPFEEPGKDEHVRIVPPHTQ